MGKLNASTHTIDPISILWKSSLSFQSMTFSCHLRVQQQHKNYMFERSKWKDFSVLKAPLYLVCPSSRSIALMWAFFNIFFKNFTTMARNSCLFHKIHIYNIKYLNHSITCLNYFTIFPFHIKNCHIEILINIPYFVVVK